MPYVQVQRMMMDDGFPAGRQNYWKSNFLKGLDSEAIEVIVDHVAQVPSPYAAVAIEQFSGAVCPSPLLRRLLLTRKSEVGFRGQTGNHHGEGRAIADPRSL